MDDKKNKKTKHLPSKLVKPIILVTLLEKDDVEASEYINHTCHNTCGWTSYKYVIKIPRFDFGTSEEWIIFVDLFQKSLVGKHATSVPPIYKCMERVLKGDAKAEFLQQANLVGSCIVINFTAVIATIAVHVFHTYAYYDQRQYSQICLRTPPPGKARSFTTRLIYLNTYLSYFPLDRLDQLFTSIPDDDSKEILYHAVPNLGVKENGRTGIQLLR